MIIDLLNKGLSKTSISKILKVNRNTLTNYIKKTT